MASKNKIVFYTLSLISISTSVYPQSELNVEFQTYAGREHNIYKSPEVLTDETTSEILDMDTIVISDFLIDVGYDIEYSKLNPGKSLFEARSDLWYRSYIENQEIGQTRLNNTISYEHYFGKKIIAGALYEFRWSDRIGSGITGDLLMRSFKYLGNSGNIYLGYIPGKKVNFDLYSEYEYKIYYKENTLDPLDHGNLSINTSMEVSPSRKHYFTIELEFLNRKYSEYHSLDNNGNYSLNNPLRLFRYYSVDLDYDLKPVRGFLISPALEVKRRIDMYQDYYSYISFNSSLRIRYIWDRFYVSLHGDIKRLKYDRRAAFTSNPADPLLVYDYYHLDLILKFELSKNWELYSKIESDNRGSNSDLEYFRTRRPYKNQSFRAGIIYTLPDIKW